MAMTVSLTTLFGVPATYARVTAAINPINQIINISVFTYLNQTSLNAGAAPLRQLDYAVKDWAEMVPTKTETVMEDGVTPLIQDGTEIVQHPDYTNLTSAIASVGWEVAVENYLIANKAEFANAVVTA